MTRTLIPLFLLLCAAPPGLWSQTNDPAVTADELKEHVRYLASDALEGRGSGTAGNRKAAEYIADQFRAYGLSPAGEQGGYFQAFPFISAVKEGAHNSMRLAGAGMEGGGAELDVDFRPLGFSSDTTVTGPLVFAGYGISAPDNKYDDYEGIGVNGAVVVVFRYSPDGTDPHGELRAFSELRNKARVAREKGAAGMIVVTGPADDDEDQLMKLTFDQVQATSGIPALCVTRKTFAPLFTREGKEIKGLQDSIRARRRPSSFRFSDATVTLSTEIVKVPSESANIAGLLNGTDPLLKNEWVVVGAHMDHLGYGGQGSGSLAPDTVAVHHGADDNASGTAALLELAQAFAARRASLKRSMLFLSFSGEELGTLGSNYFVNHPTVPTGAMVAMINLDMIGRLRGRTLSVGGTGTSPSWDSLLSHFDTDSMFALKKSPEGYGPSDHKEFYGKDIPVLFFFTDVHSDYHKPSDTWEKLDYQGEEQVVRYVETILDSIDREQVRPAFARVQSSQSRGGDARPFRVTLGIVPDYGASTSGMRISGVQPDRPAQKAGLKSGDVIVKLAGKTVMNIYDYMGILGELKPGDVVEVEVLRDGKSLTVTATMKK
jgi:aminopeptidase YwaD